MKKKVARRKTAGVMTKMDSVGYTKFFRRVWCEDMGDDLILIGLWHYLIALARYHPEPTKTRIAGQQITIQRGQAVITQNEISTRFKVGRKKVRLCLQYLQNTARINQEIGPRGTVVTICNYDEYYPIENYWAEYTSESGTPRGQVRAKLGPSKGQPLYYKNERKKEGEERKNYAGDLGSQDAPAEYSGDDLKSKPSQDDKNTPRIDEHPLPYAEIPPDMETLNSGPILETGNTPVTPKKSTATKPKKTKKAAKPKTPAKSAAAWDAYSNAYNLRWGTDPVRGPAENSMLCKLVTSVGETMACEMLKKYVANNEAWYVQKCHPLNLLLSDKQKFKTEVETGRKVTRETARTMERSSENFNSYQKTMAKHGLMGG